MVNSIFSDYPKVLLISNDAITKNRLLCYKLPWDYAIGIWTLLIDMEVVLWNPENQK